MTNLKDPRQFWNELQGTIAIHETIHENRINNNKRVKPKEESVLINIEKEVYDVEYSSGLKLILASSENYGKLFEKLFREMDRYEFKNTPSVNSAFDKHLTDFDSRYSMLKEVSLYTHTLNVAIETIKITRELPQTITDIALILAILHDFGKNNQIKKLYMHENKNEFKHHKVSSNYAKFTLQEELTSYDNKNRLSSDLVGMIYQTLRVHHDAEREDSMFLDLLTKADQNAREQELRGIILRKNIKDKSKKK